MSKPGWLKEAERQLIKTGKLDLSNELKVNLSLIPAAPYLKVLDLSFCRISSLEGLKKLQSVDTVILNYTWISSFKNFSAISHASSISLRNSPVEKTPNWKLSLYMVIGPNLRIIDNRGVSDAIKTKSMMFPPHTKDLINKGWIASFPCPVGEEMTEICREFDVEQKEAPRTEFQEIAEQYQMEQTMMASKYTMKFEEKPEEEEFSEEMTEISMFDNPMTLKERVIQVLEQNGKELPSYDDESVLAIVKELCESKSKAEV